MRMRNGRHRCTSIVGMVLVNFSTGFAPVSISLLRHPTTAMSMGLYDTPLRPRLPPREDPKDNISVEEEDDIQNNVTKRLFVFGEDGKEVRNLLPRLKRRLDSGVACYFEPTDRLVQNLVEKTSVFPVDACWALEACEGDIAEAWTRISVARRLLLDEARAKMLVEEDNDYDEDDYKMEVLDDFVQNKRKEEAGILRRSRDEYWKPSEPDTQWLPTKNPNPVNDEPWFTG